MFTAGQARAAGIPDEVMEQRLLEKEWLTLYPQVFIAATTPTTALSRIWAALLVVGRRAIVAGATAAWLHHLPGHGEPTVIELVVPDTGGPGAGRPRIPGVRLRRVRPATIRAVRIRGLPVTPLAVTIRDLAAEQSEQSIRATVQHALRLRRTTMSALADTLGRGLSGAARLRRALVEVAPGYQSYWEGKLHRALLRRGVRLRPQLRVALPDGRVAFLDLGSAEFRLGVEIDGYVAHLTRFTSDRVRDRLLCIAAGYTILRYAVDELARDLERAADEIAAFIRNRAAARCTASS